MDEEEGDVDEWRRVEDDGDGARAVLGSGGT